jgi:predicted metallopeptidase
MKAKLRKFIDEPREQIPGVFRTKDGYRGGYIISRVTNTYKVLFTRDELGDIIHEIGYVQVKSHVIPKRLNSKEIQINTNREGYIKAGESIDLGLGLGSKESVLIHNPLTFHNLLHQNILTYTSAFIMQLIDEYFSHGAFSEKIVDRAHWLINVVLLIDNFELISKDVFLEALTNFCLDYIILPPGTLIRQPINYIFDILDIDGVY